MAKLRKCLNFMLVLNDRRLRKVLLGMAVAACTSAPGVVHAKKYHQSSRVEAADATDATDATDAAVTTKKNPDDYEHYTYTFEELGALGPIELQGVDGYRNLTVSTRNDDVVTEAKLKLNYAWSPALIPELSHLKVMLNDELMTSLPLPHENSNGQVSDIKLDPTMFVDFNKFKLQLIGHYTRDCEDPLHSTLWANISNKSKFELTVRRLNLSNDLALLP
ncbi:MAG: cellulose biosynthesis cyclic di-GMP-binding regulatory protein BcsB, partial [Gallionella sp.]